MLPLTSSRRMTGSGLAFGAVNQELRPFPQGLSESFRSRNNQLLWHALAQIEDDIAAAKQRFGADRIAVVMGTSTSGADENIPLFRQAVEQGAWAGAAFKQPQQLMSAPADFVAEVYGLHNLCYGVSTACTSGARALISAARLLRAGLCDAVVCGGVDTLSPLTINGFASLEVLSGGIANPFSTHRDGINIGEAAALFVMSKQPATTHAIALLGAGASSDAHHISAPEPSGRGAVQAMHTALSRAKVQPHQIAYLNLHGTATQHNDAMESHAVAQVFPEGVPCSSTKPMTGHTLGAAGALEAAFCWLSLSHGGALAPHVWDGQGDPALPALNWVTPGQTLAPAPQRCLMSNSFAFGGNNVSLIIGEAP